LRFVVEFDGAAVAALSTNENLTVNIDYGAGTEPVTLDLFKNQFNHTWRLVIEIVEPRQALNLRARLERRGHPITETWDYT
jgi:glucan biosynthesis protein